MSECKHEIKELIDDGGNCKKCGEWYSLLFWYRSQQARIADLENQLARMNGLCEESEEREAMLLRVIHEVMEIYAGMEGFKPETAPEGYCLRIIEQMYKAAAGLEGGV